MLARKGRIQRLVLQEVVEINLELDSGNKVDGASDVLHEGGPWLSLCEKFAKGASKVDRRPMKFQVGSGCGRALDYPAEQGVL